MAMISIHKLITGQRKRKEKIEKARIRRLKDLKKSVLEGKIEDFLEGANTLDLIFLKQDLGLMEIEEQEIEIPDINREKIKNEFKKR